MTTVTLPQKRYTAPRTEHIYSAGDIARIVTSYGSHFFEPSTTRFFKSRICPEVFPFRPPYARTHVFLFVTSEKGPDDVRGYTVRVWDPREPRQINRASGFQAFPTKARAVRFAREIAASRVLPST